MKKKWTGMFPGYYDIPAQHTPYIKIALELDILCLQKPTAQG